MNNTIKIRYGRESDADIITDFNKAMAEETEGRTLDRLLLRQGVANVLNNREHGFYLVAEQVDKVIASLMITKEWSDWRNGIFWWIQSVYVDPNYRNQGVYSQLYARVRTMAREAGNICGLRLYVERDNEIAQHTYQKLGMLDSGYKVYQEEF